MLIYLDNSHLNMLEELLRDEPDRFERFRQRWVSSHWILAVSQTHAAEITQSSDISARERRYHSFVSCSQFERIYLSQTSPP